MLLEESGNTMLKNGHDCREQACKRQEEGKLSRQRQQQEGEVVWVCVARGGWDETQVSGVSATYTTAPQTLQLGQLDNLGNNLFVLPVISWTAHPPPHLTILRLCARKRRFGRGVKGNGHAADVPISRRDGMPVGE